MRIRIGEFLLHSTKISQKSSLRRSFLAYTPSLCERDLRIYAHAFGGELFHYQDYRNQEIDAVIVLPNGSWAAFEIELGANFNLSRDTFAYVDLERTNGGEVKEKLSLECRFASCVLT